MSQQIAWFASLALMSLVASGFLFVALQSRRRVEYAPLQKHAYRLRGRLFWILTLVLAPVMVTTLIDLPYAAADDSTTPVQVVDATGYQWRWELSRNGVTVGQPVEFRVTSADVNHGFGIYDGELRLVAQTQAMPGYTNTFRHTFAEEGTYRVLCLEYCGLVHHGMVTEIHVGSL